MNTKHQSGSFWLSAIFILAILGLIAVLMAPVLTDIQSFASRFGFKSRTELKQDVKKANTNLEIATGENQNLEKKIENQAASGEASVVAVDTKHKVDQTIDERAAVVKDTQRKKMESFDSKYPPNTITPTVKIAKSQEIAIAQIDSLWSAYCSFNENTKCPSAVNS